MFQLAADAGNAIAMTDDEKNRLADILEDLDEVDDAIIEDRVAHTTSAPPGIWDSISYKLKVDLRFITCI